jgi:hypothetical protein
MELKDIISSVGVFFILLAFFLMTFNFLSEKSKMYFILNIVGGSFAFAGAFLMNSIPFMIMEIIWVLVAVYGILKHLKKQA